MRASCIMILPSLKFVYGFRIRKCKFLRIRFQMSFLICFSNLFFRIRKKVHNFSYTNMYALFFVYEFLMHLYSYMNVLYVLSCTIQVVSYSKGKHTRHSYTERDPFQLLTSWNNRNLELKMEKRFGIVQ